MEQIKLNCDVLEKVIELAEQYEKEEKTSGKVTLEDVSSYPPQSLRRLCKMLEWCTYPQLLGIEAVMLLGRGDYDTIEEALQDMMKEYPEEYPGAFGLAITYIVGKLTLSRYLKDGIAKINFSELEATYE